MKPRVTWYRMAHGPRWLAHNADGEYCWHSTWEKAIVCALDTGDECPVEDR